MEEKKEEAEVQMDEKEDSVLALDDDGTTEILKLVSKDGQSFEINSAYANLSVLIKTSRECGAHLVFVFFFSYCFLVLFRSGFW